MPYERFSIIPGNPEDTLKMWSRKLEFLLNKNLSIDNISSTNLATKASLVGVVDSGGYYGSTNHTVENALQQIGSTFTNIPSGNVKITDTGSYYTSTSVEGALQELGSTFLNIPAGNVKLVDASSYFASTSAEGGFQELGIHINDTTIHFNTTTITTLTPINSSNIVYDASTSFAVLSTVLTGTTELTSAVALNSDLISANNTINAIRQRLVQVGIFTT